MTCQNVKLFDLYTIYLINNVESETELSQLQI